MKRYDKVVVIKSRDEWDYPVGTELIIKSFYTSANGYKCFMSLGETMGCVLDYVIPKELYDSPLYQALK